MTDILQAVRPHWKVHFTVYVLIHIDQTLCDALGIGCVAFRQCRYRSWLVATVMIDWCLRVLSDLPHELLPHVTLILVSVRPEGIVLRGVSLTHQQTNQIIETPIGYPFHVHKQFHRLPR